MKFFGQAPNFHETSLHQDTAFGGIETFRDVESPGAQRAYRTLRLAMENQRAREEEGMFFALEQKSRRLATSRRYAVYWLSLGYEVGSNYGISIARPLFLFLGGIALSAFLLYSIGIYSKIYPTTAGESQISVPMIFDALEFSFRQTVLPFDALRAKSSDLENYAFNPGGTRLLKIWGSILTVIEALFLLLLFLSARWRYRR